MMLERVKSYAEAARILAEADSRGERSAH